MNRVVILLLLMTFNIGAAAQDHIFSDDFESGWLFAWSEVVGLRAPVQVTGQTQCWDEDQIPRDCVGTGEDGEFQAGVEWPTPRFTDNGDGTVFDNLTGLTWLKDANCAERPPPGEDGMMLWQEALDWVESLNTDFVPCRDYTQFTFTDWRLPNIRELLSLVSYGQTNPTLPVGHPFWDVQLAPFYWSSTSQPASPTGAFKLNTSVGGAYPDNKSTDEGYVWPVRGGY